MQVISNRKKIVESTYPPQDTNVLWVDLSEDKEKKVKSIKEYKNGNWKEIVDNNVKSSDLDFKNPDDIAKSCQTLTKFYIKNIESVAPELGNPEALVFTKLKLFMSTKLNHDFETIDKIYIDKSDFDNFNNENKTIGLIGMTLVAFNKPKGKELWDTGFTMTYFPEGVSKEKISSIKDESYREIIVFGCSVNNLTNEFTTLPDWFIEKYKAE